MNHSHNKGEDVIVTVVSSLAIGTNVEHLWEFECVLVIHAQSAVYKDEHAAWNRSFLHILACYLVLDVVETEGLDFLPNFLQSSELGAIVVHGALLVVERDQIVSVAHDCCVIGL